MKNILITTMFLVLFIIGKNAIASGPLSKVTTACSYSKNDVNIETGAFVRIMKGEPLVSHLGNNSNLLSADETDDSFTAYAYIANYNNSFVLYLRMEVLSTEAKERYGSIFAGDKLLFKLSDGEVVTLEAGKSELGNLNGLITNYSSFYPISADLLMQLKKKKLEKVRVHWSNGYLDYEVDNQEVLIRQLSCVE